MTHTGLPDQKLRAVFLDRGTFPSYIKWTPPACVGEWKEYPFSSEPEITERLTDADIAVVNKSVLRSANLSNAKRLKLISLVATGSNNIDLEYCRKHSIAVANIRDYTTRSLAEHTLALIFALRRRLPAYRRRIAAGEWQQNRHFVLFDKPIEDLQGDTIGIIGRGKLGIGLAELAQAIGMRAVFAERKGVTNCRPGYLPFTELLSTADIVSLHCPHSPQNDKMIGDAELSLMKKTAFLINTARGALVDEAALARALRQKQIAGAGLDVLATEPPSATNPLLSMANEDCLLITPHTAWTSMTALNNAYRQTMENIEGFFAGSPKRLLT